MLACMLVQRTVTRGTMHAAHCVVAVIAIRDSSQTALDANIVSIFVF